MSKENESKDDQPADSSRRRLLKYATLIGVVGGGVASAWTLSRPDTSSEVSTPPDASPTDDIEQPTEEVPSLVERYAPDLYFGSHEKWYPTDPRNYRTETDDGPVVDGLLALDEYSATFREEVMPPEPTVFYRTVEAATGVDAIQYWFYSVFDQFTVNFHWHDWELLQVFIDRETEEPILVSASAHSRAIPNNEVLEPNLTDGRRMGILSEVGSHSSASEVNDIVPSFERFSSSDWSSDVTNDVLHTTANLAAPFAYGLPRGEGARLPFVMPELEGYRLDEHPELSVGPDDFIDEGVTVGSWSGLPSPPQSIPLREPGLVLAAPGSTMKLDTTYSLEPMERVRESVEDFTGPQLSFEFAVPGFIENSIASHITSVEIPWEQERYTNPLDDVTDPSHRQRVDGTLPGGLTNRVVGRVRQLGSGPSGALGRVTDEARESLDDVITVSFSELPVECAVRLASENPEATVTRNGVFGYLHVVPGEHLLVVNGPGYAPLGQRFVHDGGLFQAGSGGELTVVATEEAGWIRGDARDANGVSHVRVIEDYAGVVYDGRPVEDDRFAVAVHRDGRYTVEVVDADGRPGTYRVGPDTFDDEFEAVRETIETGKAPLATTLLAELEELFGLARTLAGGEDNELLDRLSRAQEEVAAATRLAERGNPDAMDDQLSNAVSLLEEAIEVLTSDRQRVYDDPAVATLAPRIRAALDRAETAIGTELV